MCVCSHPASWHSPGRCHGTDEEHYLCGCRGLHIANYHSYRPRFEDPGAAREYIDNAQRYGVLRRTDDSLLQVSKRRKVIDVHLPEPEGPLPPRGEAVEP